MGFVVASVEYRLSSEAPHPAAFVDVQDAIRWLRANAKKYDIDKSRTVVWGGSAGGHLSALVGTACGDLVNEPSAAHGLEPHNADESACVQGVAIWYGIFDFGPIVSNLPSDERVVSQYIGCNGDVCAEVDVRAASPTTYIDPADPPFLLIHGENDSVVSTEQSRIMESRLQSAGVGAELLVIAGVDHSFIGATPERTREASLWALQTSVDFMHKVLRTATQ
jgi:acetyl esterase/lipase